MIMQTYLANKPQKLDKPKVKPQQVNPVKRPSIPHTDWEDWVDGFATMLVSKTLSL